MTILAYQPHFWSTATNGTAADTQPADLSELGDHLGSCQNSHRHLQTLRFAASSIRGFVAARLVTTVMVGVACLGIYIWLF